MASGSGARGGGITPCAGKDCMTQRGRTKLVNRLLKHVRIALGAIALLLIAASVYCSGGPGWILAQVAHAGEVASSEIVDTLHMLDVEFSLSEPVYRGTDRGVAMVILALVLAVILAFNIWFVRHLRCVYAPSPQATARRQLADSLHELNLPDPTIASDPSHDFERERLCDEKGRLRARRSCRARDRDGERFTRPALTSGTDAPGRRSAARRARVLRA
jgi:hypothetical protein